MFEIKHELATIKDLTSKRITIFTRKVDVFVFLTEYKVHQSLKELETSHNSKQALKRAESSHGMVHWLAGWIIKGVHTQGLLRVNLIFRHFAV